MKRLNLKKHLSASEVLGKIVAEKSFEFVSRSFPQGEWAVLASNKNESFLSFSLRRNKGADLETAFFGVAPLPELGPVNSKSEDIEVAPAVVDAAIISLLQKAWELRNAMGFNVHSSRLFYGDIEGLLGLQVDSYLNAVLVQIGTYGIALKNQLIKDFYGKLFPDKKVLVRYKTDFMEVYPVPEGEATAIDLGLDRIRYEENGISYDVPFEVIQKNGHYFDQVKNRTKIGHLLDQQKAIGRGPQRGLDLFCYTGGWGHLFLQKGCQYVSFVDQGAFAEVIQRTHQANRLPGQLDFHRSDVFNFLDKSISEKRTYDLVSCDPPPFAKSFATKDNALSGYDRLSNKLCKVMAPYGLLVFSSCTRYVSMEELQRIIHEAAKKNQRKAFLVELGTQPLDHPFTTFNDHSFYLKMVTYLIILD